MPILDAFRIQIEAENRDYGLTKAFGQVIILVLAILCASVGFLSIKKSKKDLPDRSLCCIVSCDAIIEFPVC